MTVVELIAMAGGLGEYANKKNIRVVRTEEGETFSYLLNYDDFLKGATLRANIPLLPGDIVSVP